MEGRHQPFQERKPIQQFSIKCGLYITNNVRCGVPITPPKGRRQVARLPKLLDNAGIRQKPRLGKCLNPTTHSSGSYTKLGTSDEAGFESS